MIYVTGRRTERSAWRTSRRPSYRKSHGRGYGNQPEQAAGAETRASGEPVLWYASGSIGRRKKRGRSVDVRFTSQEAVMKWSFVALLAVIAFGIAVILPAWKPVEAGSGAHAARTKITAEEYCVKKGGQVDVREPYYNTNGDEQSWLRLSGARQFCKFTSKKDGSRIHVELSTLFTEEPSLAALAYYAAVPLSGSCNGNP